MKLEKRVDDWKKRLLDLGKRNSLINFKLNSKSILRLTKPSIYELWEYIAINPVRPYVNWQLISDGTETITTMWQLKQNNVTGLLYWAVDYWKVNYWGKDPWAANQYGDGFLVYSGYSFDMLEPIPSTRLESIRDGIEDYQKLCMLEDKLGSDVVDDLITRITTSVVTYTRDDDLIHAVRVLLGDMLESALN